MSFFSLPTSFFWFQHIKWPLKMMSNHFPHKMPVLVSFSGFFTFGWLCWGLTSQSTFFQSCRDGAIASWVINQYFRGVKCLAQGHNTAAVGLEPRTSRSGVRHSTTEPPRSLDFFFFTWLLLIVLIFFYFKVPLLAKKCIMLRIVSWGKYPYVYCIIG